MLSVVYLVSISNLPLNLRSTKASYRWTREPDPSILLCCRTVVTFHVVKDNQVMPATEVIR